MGDIEDRVHKAYEREQSKRWEWEDEETEVIENPNSVPAQILKKIKQNKKEGES